MLTPRAPKVRYCTPRPCGIFTIPHIAFFKFVDCQWGAVNHHFQNIFRMSETFMPNVEQLKTLQKNEISSFRDVHIPGGPSDSCHDVNCLTGSIRSITSADNSTSDSAKQKDYRLIVPGLCHPHIHLDKCFLLSHPKYADLEINDGDFSEAMKLTSVSLSDCFVNHQADIAIINEFLTCSKFYMC